MNSGFRRYRSLWFGLAIVLAALVCVATWIFGPPLLNMKSEYVTARVISDVRIFVEKNDGKWPKSWQDLGGHDYTAFTTMNFNLDPDTASRDEVVDAIQPRSGKYYTYPHAREQLESLYDALAKCRSRNATVDEH